MISEIVKRNKERQKRYLKGCDNCPSISKLCDRCNGKIEAHKQTLIDFREYLEDEVLPNYQSDSENSKTGSVFETGFRLEQLKEDIEELNKMVKKYDKV